MTQLNKEDAEELIATWSQHQVASFRQYELFHRMKVHEVLGFPSLKELIETRLGGYIRLTSIQRLEAIKELEAQGYTKNTEMAEILGVSDETVRRGRKTTNVDAPKPDQPKPRRHSTNVESAKLKADIERLRTEKDSLKEKVTEGSALAKKLKRQSEIHRQEREKLEKELADLRLKESNRRREDMDLQIISEGGKIPTINELQPPPNEFVEALKDQREAVERRNNVLEYLQRVKRVTESVPKVLQHNTVDDEELAWIGEANKLLSDAVFEVTRITLNKKQVD